MRTLVFCTAYAATAGAWEARYRRWLDAVPGAALGADQVLIVDDGSPVLPGWRDVQVFSGDTLGEAYTVGPRGSVLLFHFRGRLGRRDVTDFPGWHRSFAFAALYAEANGFDRVIHVESDAFLISAGVQEFFAAYVDGWAALWSPRYDAPEMALQVAAGSGLRRLAEFARSPYAAIVGHNHERALPFSACERRFVGDRYGEFDDFIPRGVDFATQVQTQREAGYTWWLAGGAGGPAGPEHGPVHELQFGTGGNAGPLLAGGWAEPEVGWRWMTGVESVLALPVIVPDVAYVLLLSVTPHVYGDLLTRQRLIVQVNETILGEYEIELEAVLGCDIPAGLLRSKGINRLRLIHPDGAAPQSVAPEQNDRRRLSVSVKWMRLIAQTSRTRLAN